MVEKNTNFSDLVSSRRTVHEFSQECPPRNIIVDAIEKARWAPNHHRTEPWHFYFPSTGQIEKICEQNATLIRDAGRGSTNGGNETAKAAAESRAKAEKIAAIKLRRWLTMPGWLVLTCQRNADPLREQEDYAACCCAAQNLLLLLWEQGIGAKWTTGKITREPAFFDILGVDFAKEFTVGMFWYGYPSTIPEQHRLPVEDIVSISQDNGLSAA